ncbi:MAG TPA: hypothetical protein PLO06_10260, partial [Methanoregulaceae archaeon]|nr:hypothetical protein [Methanoregulaceae archaeon]
PVSEKEVLGSAMLASPISALDMYPVSDGACALIMANEEWTRRLTDKPVWVTGVGVCRDTYNLGTRDLSGCAALIAAYERERLERAFELALGLTFAAIGGAFVAMRAGWMPWIFNPNTFGMLGVWFVYLIAIVAAANVLQLEFLTMLFQNIVLFLPHIAMFLIILIGGFILVDYFSDLLAGWGKTQNIEFLGVIILLLRVFFYFIILMLALSQLQIDLTIIYTFITPLAWGVGIGLGAGIAIFLGFGLKDRAPRMMDDLINKISK